MTPPMIQNQACESMQPMQSGNSYMLTCSLWKMSVSAFISDWTDDWWSCRNESMSRRNCVARRCSVSIVDDIDLLTVDGCPDMVDVDTSDMPTFCITQYTQCLKNAQNYFCQNFVRFSPTVKSFGTKMANTVRCNHFPPHLIHVNSLLC